MPGTLGFLAEGYRELGRKVSRAGLRRRLVATDRERQTALTQLGRTAWQAKAGLADFADLRGHLEQLDARAGDLSATATRLDAERADLQARRQAEVNRFDALLTPAKAAQSDADAALRTAKAALAERDGAIRAIETRLAGLAADLAKLSDPSAASASGGPGSQGSSVPANRDQIEAQRKALADQTGAETAARARCAADVETRAAASQRGAAETARIDGERKAALQPIDADLERIRQSAAAATSESATVGSDQTKRFLELGTAMYERRVTDPALAESVQAVAGVDAGRAATQAAIDGSLGQTRAMPAGTMAKFLTVAVLVPVVLAAVGYGLYSRLGPGEFGSDFGGRSSATGIALTSPVVADEHRKDETVRVFMDARSDQARRAAAIEILEADIRALGSATDRSAVPLLLTILERGEPELRAAAAHALGMIKPTAAEVPALIKALNDPVPLVRDAALSALGQVSDPAAQLLVGRVHAGAPASRSQDNALTPTVAPDEARLGMRIYPGATFLAYASDPANGRASFSSADPMQKVVEFYAAASGGRPPASGEEFTRLYFGGSADDPTGMMTLTAENQTWMERAMATGMPQADFQAEADRRGARMMDLPLVRYAQTAFYGSPVFLATEVASSGGKTRVVRYAVVFQDQALGVTGFALHIAAEAIRK